jgi:KDO2-lipid IV(A) lauroyltransferase
MLRSLYASIYNGSFGTIAGIRSAQLLPNQLGYFTASQVAKLQGRRTHSPLVQAIKLNQWVVRGGNLTQTELDAHVKKVLYFQSRALFETFRYMDRPDRIGSLVSLSDKTCQVLNDQQRSKRGLVLLLTHLCGFDLGGLKLADAGYKFLNLTFPNPPAAYQLQNDFRRKHGMEIMPISFNAMQAAIERLRQGGVILTGLDRPNPELEYAPLFYGRPARLPVGHIRLALKTHAAVRIISTVAAPGNKYIVDVSDEIPMTPNADPHEEVIQNAERTLIETQKFINQDPDRWAMFFPVWPEAAAELPTN